MRLTRSNLERTFLFIHWKVLEVHDAGRHDCQSLGVEHSAVRKQSRRKILYSLDQFILKYLANTKANNLSISVIKVLSIKFVSFGSVYKLCYRGYKT